MCGRRDESRHAVVLVVLCTETQRFLMLKELQDKPQVFKTKGMLAFPSETREKADGCICATAQRLVHEEIGLSSGLDVAIVESLDCFKHGVRVYTALAFVSAEFVASPNDDDVAYHGWLTGDEIRQMSKHPGHLRIETIRVLDAVSTAIR